MNGRSKDSKTICSMYSAFVMSPCQLMDAFTLAQGGVEWMRYRFIYLGVGTPLYRCTYIPTYKGTILTVLTPTSGHPYRVR